MLDLTVLAAGRHVATGSHQRSRQNAKQFLHRFPRFQSQVEISQHRTDTCRRQVCDLSMLRRDSFIRLLMTVISANSANECSKIAALRGLSIAETMIGAV